QIAEAAELGRDINQVLLRVAEAQMAHMALHDALTGLPNRRLLIDRISSALDRAERHGLEVAILFCDLDDFKRVNDTAGHAAGDAVLVEAAARLSSVLRAGDSVARVGGDEFVIVLEPTSDGDPTAAGETADPRSAANIVAERIKTELTRPINYQNGEHLISVSVGITFAAGGGLAEDALRDADVAMYRAKHSGKNRVATFDDSLRAGILERAAAEMALQAALQPAGPAHAHPRLAVFYEPVIHLDSGGLVGFEAVPRLTDFTGEHIPDDVLAYVAEHSGMISVLGETVLEAALEALAHRRATYPADEPVRMAFALSARQAQQSDMPALVHAALKRHGLRPTDLALQLTESVLIEAGSSTLRQLAELRADGVGIARADFGAGTASLSRLASLPIDAIKVDRSFMAGVPDDAINTKIVRAIAGLAEDLGLSCIFAGIDSKEQLAALPKGVLAQGRHLGESAATPRDDRPRPGKPLEPAA
ncbi:MAG: EAL domain-containing protein, partial [Nakamurella sp.]